MMAAPLILNIETATEVCSVSLSKGGSLLSLRESGDMNDHAKVITLLIEACMKDAAVSLQTLDAVAVSSGPGSYTSLRVGTSAAKGICYALDKPLIVVDTLQALALAALLKEGDKEALYCPMIDARRMEVYNRLFDGENLPVTETAAEVIDVRSYQNYFASKKRIIFCGNGAGKCRPVLTCPEAFFSDVTRCSASWMPVLSHQAFAERYFADLAYYVPRYFKAPNITMPTKTTL